MKRPLLRAVALLGACTLVFTIGGCSSASSSASGKEAVGKSQSVSASKKSRGTDELNGTMPKLTVEQVNSRWDGQTFAGENMHLLNLNNPKIANLLSEEIEKASLVKTEPAECSILLGGVNKGVDYKRQLKDMTLLITASRESNVMSIGYNVNPKKRIPNSIEADLKLKDKCKDVTVDGSGKVHLEISTLPEYNSIATLTYHLCQAGSKGEIACTDQLVLKNGQLIMVQAKNPDADKQALDDALKYLGIHK